MKYCERIDKILSASGIMTRSQSAKAASSGRISLNGVAIKNTAVKATDKDILTLDGTEIIYNRFVYLMMNKPGGYVSSTDQPGERTVLELLNPPYSNIEMFPAGRLDKDTTGFLLLTNDGEAAHRLLAPSSHVPKQYFLRTADEITESDIDGLKNGCSLSDGYTTKPCGFERGDDMRSGVITLSEGKYHQIKRMFGSLGNKIVELRRISFGNVPIDPNLEPGEYRNMTEKELETLGVRHN